MKVMYTHAHIHNICTCTIYIYTDEERGVGH